MRKMEKKEIKKIRVPKGEFCSEWFKCLKCGREVQILALGDHATCSECGGMMVRK